MTTWSKSPTYPSWLDPWLDMKCLWLCKMDFNPHFFLFIWTVWDMCCIFVIFLNSFVSAVWQVWLSLCPPPQNTTRNSKFSKPSQVDAHYSLSIPSLISQTTLSYQLILPTSSTWPNPIFKLSISSFTIIVKFSQADWDMSSENQNKTNWNIFYW